MIQKRKAVMLLGALAATTLVLSACGAGSTAGTDKTNGKNQDLVTNNAPSVTGAAGSELDLGNGIKVKISDPKHFTPGAFASNYIKGQTANLFETTVTNSGKSPLDWATVSFVTSSTNGANCTDVLDGDNGVDGQPSDPLTAGQSVTFKFGVACDTKPGADLNVLITVGDKSAEVKGKLA